MLNNPPPPPRSDAWNEDSGDGSGDEPDDLATGTKQKRAAQPEEQEQELSAYERQCNANVQLNRGVLEGLGLADTALSHGRQAKAPAKKRVRLEEPAEARARSTRPTGGDRRRYSEDLLGRRRR